MENEFCVSKIDMIKIIRNTTGYGLVDSKNIAEAYLDAWNEETINDMHDFLKFINFVSKFIKGAVEINPDGEMVFTRPNVLDNEDIKNLSQ